MPTTRDTGYISAYPVIVAYGEVYGVATGGTSSSITVGGINYTLLTFTSDSTLTVTTSGLFDLYILSGGGGGGKDADGAGGHRGGGGGAGGVFQATGVYLTANQTVTVGAGGAAAATGATAGSQGAPSRVGDFYALQGGGGAYSSGVDAVGINPTIVGGSSGGGSKNITFNSITQGNKGGIHATPYAGAGGGGKGAVGGDGASTTGGNGGAGVDVSAFIGGSALFKAAGGGGAGQATGGTGGSSIGGTGSTSAVNATGAAANTASGGGGASDGRTAGAGGSGIVYVRFKV